MIKVICQALHCPVAPDLSTHPAWTSWARRSAEPAHVRIRVHRSRKINRLLIEALSSASDTMMAGSVAHCESETRVQRSRADIEVRESRSCAPLTLFPSPAAANTGRMSILRQGVSAFESTEEGIWGTGACPLGA